jgi:hypothetical protein
MSETKMFAVNTNTCFQRDAFRITVEETYILL